MPEKVEHVNLGQKYRMVIERSAVKGIDGFKVEANGDEIDTVVADAEGLYLRAARLTLPPPMEVKSCQNRI